MPKAKVSSPYPLIIEVNKTFPLRRIKSINIKDPKETYRDDITVDREQAKYLLESLKEIMGEDPDPQEEPKL